MINGFPKFILRHISVSHSSIFMLPVHLDLQTEKRKKMKKEKTNAEMKEFDETMLEEMVVQILSRLPPKSLMRFKCVHKSWHSLINNPRFAANHLHFYSENSFSTCILFKRTVVQRVESESQEIIVFSFLRLPNDDHGNLPYVVEDLDFPPSVGLDNRGQFIELEFLESVDIIGHCDGIICLSLYTGDLVLCNPATKEFKIVPETFLSDWTGCAMGFGYDPKSNDYTIVNVASYDEEVYEQRRVHSPPKAEVYTLGTDCWREINTNFLETETTIFWPFFFQIYLKGTFYWLGYEQNKESISFYRRLEEEYVRQVIVLFDTSDEVFHSMLLPDSFYEPSFGVYTMRLAMWKESIALYGFHCFTYFEIWVMGDISCVNGSWTKHVNFEPLEDYFVLSLAFWKSEEIIMVANDGRIVTYNVATKKFKYLPIHGVYPGSFEAVVCMNSIVSVNGDNKLAGDNV